MLPSNFWFIKETDKQFNRYLQLHDIAEYVATGLNFQVDRDDYHVWNVQSDGQICDFSFADNVPHLSGQLVYKPWKIAFVLRRSCARNIAAIPKHIQRQTEKIDFKQVRCTVNV